MSLMKKIRLFCIFWWYGHLKCLSDSPNIRPNNHNNSKNSSVLTFCWIRAWIEIEIHLKLEIEIHLKLEKCGSKENLRVFFCPVDKALNSNVVTGADKPISSGVKLGARWSDYRG